MGYGLTYPEMRALVYDKAGVSSSNSLLTSAKVLAHLWQVQLRFVRAALSAGIVPVNLRTQDDLNLATSNPHYLPADCMMVLQLRASDSNGYWTTLRQRTAERQDEDEDTWEDTTQTASDGPTVFVMRGVETTFGSNYGKPKVDILPVPTTAVTDGLRCRYVRYPMPWSSFSSGTNSLNVIVDIPGEFHEDIVHGAVWEFFTNNPTVPRQDYDKHRQLYEAAIRSYVAMQGETNQVSHEGTFGSAIFGQVSSYWDSL